jgi:hypothetical protein
MRTGARRGVEHSRGRSGRHGRNCGLRLVGIQTADCGVSSPTRQRQRTTRVSESRRADAEQANRKGTAFGAIWERAGGRLPPAISPRSMTGG